MDRTTQDALVKEKLQLNELVNGILDKADKEHRQITGTEKGMIDRADERIGEIRAALGQNGAPENWGSAGRRTRFELEDARPDAELALRAWLLGPRAATAEQIAAAERVGLPYQAAELRALSIGSATAGGNSVQNEITRSYLEVLKWYGRVEGLATVLNTETGATLPYPTVNDSGNTGRLLTEGTGATTTTDPSFGVVNLGAYKFSSDAVIVSQELLQDSSVPIATYLGSALGTRIGRIKNTYFTTGTGTSQPGGVQVQASLGKTASATNAIVFDEILDLFHSLDVAYRSSPRFAFMMSDTIAAVVRKLKDSQNRYLWEMSTQVGQPDRILGAPVVINNDMDSTLATNKRLILCGDFSRYVVRNAGPVQLMRSDDIKFLEGQAVFLGFQRSDGNLIDTTAVRYLRTA
jgi:HK97 family phage major capsid protein